MLCQGFFQALSYAWFPVTGYSNESMNASISVNNRSSLRPVTLLKNGTLVQVFSCELCEISKNTFFTEHFWATAFEIIFFNVTCK